MEKSTFKSLQLISVRWWNATAYYAIAVGEVLHRHGYPVLLAGRADSPPIREARRRQLPVYDRINLETVNPLKFGLNLHRLKRLLARENIPLLNSHRPEDHLTGGLLKRHFPELIHVRTVGDVRPPRNHALNRMLHLRWTDFFIFSSLANKRRYQAVWPLPEEKTAVIYAPVDTEHFRPGAVRSGLRDELGIPADAFLFGVVGRLSPVKDHGTFLRAAALLQKKFPEPHFLISGEEVEIRRTDLLQIARELELRNLHLLDRQRDVREVIAALNVGVVSSRGSEAICRIAGEYLAMGKPVILTRVNVLPEMITDGREGFLVPPENPEVLAQKMEELFTHPDLYARMQQNARRRAEEEFSLENFFRKTVQVYHQLLEKTQIE